MSFKKYLILCLFLSIGCVESPKKGTLLTDTIDQNKLTVDAGPTLYSKDSITTKATVSKAPDLTYAWTAAAGVTFSDATMLNPQVSATIEGIYTLTLTATSEGKSVSDTVSLVIDKTAPTVNAGTDVTDAGDPFIPTSSASDTSPLSYSWSKVSGPGVVSFSNANSLRPTISMSASGTYVLKLAATDAAGNTAEDSFQAAVDMLPPVITAMSDEVKNASFTKTATVTDDSSVSYLWSKVSGTGTITFSQPTSNTTNISASADGTYLIRLTATDAFNNQSSKDFTLKWDTTAPAISLASINTNKALEITGTITELTPTTYLWEKVAGPGTVTFSSASSKTTSVSASQDGSYTLRLTVTDFFGLSTATTTTLIWDTTAPSVSLGTDPLHANGPFNIIPTITETNPIKKYKWSYVAFQPLSLLLFSDDAVANPIIQTTAEGKYRLKLVVTDGAGNATTKEIYLFWDTTAPQVTAPNDLQLKTATNITATANDASATVAWTSIPAGVTFTPNNALTTSVSAADGTYVLTVTVTDVAGNTASDTTNLLWDATAPVITMPADVVTNTPKNLDVTTSDMTPMTYSWSKVSGPGTATFNTENAEDSIASVSGEGTYVLRLTATDQLGNSASGTVQFIWDTTPPTVNAGIDAIKKAGYTQDATASDDRGTITYLWSKVSGPGTLTFSSATTQDPTITASTSGDYIVKLEVTDDAGNSNSDTFNLQWDTVLPTVNAGIDRKTNALITQDATVTETNLQSVLWTQQAGPGTVTFGSPSAVDTTMTANVQGSYTLRLTATDTAGNTANDSMTLVWDTTAPSTNAGADQIKNALFTQDATITDALSGMGTYLWSKVSGPGTITFTNSAVQDPQLSANTDGTYVLQVTATDQAGNSSTDTFQLIWDTSLPVVNAGVDSVQTASFTQNATVTDATTLTYLWAKVSGPGTITFGTANAEDTTISADSDGQYVIRLTATDQVTNSASDTFTLTWDTAAPVVDVGADESKNAAFLKTATVSDANSAAGLSYLWEKTAGPGTITFSAPTAKDTTISASTDGTYTLRLTVTDIAGHSSSDSFTLTWDNSIPVVNAGSDQVKTASFTQNATVSDNSPLTYLWEKVSGPGNITFGTANAEDTTISADSDGQYVIRLTATDSLNNSASDTFTLTWDEFAPTINMGSATELRRVAFTKDITVSDTNSGLGLTYLWSKSAGPGTVNFSSTSTEDPSISATTDGSYTIQVTVTDIAGNSATETFTLTWDTTPPTVNAGADESKNASFSHAGTASDASGIASTSWSSSPAANLSFSDAAILNPTITVTSDGTYTLTLTAFDQAGNSATDSYTLLYDSNTPLVDAGFDVITRTPTLQNALIVEGNINTILWSGAGLTFSNSATEDTTISATVDGNYTATLTVTDKAGNSASDSLSFIWDTTPPAVNAGADQQRNAAYTHNATISDATTSATILWSMTSGPGTITFSNSTIEDPVISASVDGSYVVTVTATDQAGNTSSDSFTLLWDTTAPTVTLSTPQSGDSTFIPNPLITDLSTYTCAWSYQSGPGTANYTPDNTSCAPTISGLTPGDHTFRIDVTDSLGNGPTSATVVYTSDGLKLLTQSFKPTTQELLYFFDVSEQEDQQAYCELVGRQIIKHVEWTLSTSDYICEQSPKAFVRLNLTTDPQGNLLTIENKVLRQCEKRKATYCIGTDQDQ